MTPIQPSWTVKANRPIRYDIVRCDNIFNPNEKALLSTGRSDNPPRIIIIDSNVHSLYSAKINNYFKTHQTPTKIIQFESGEENKNIESLQKMLRDLNATNLDRRSQPVIAIGGGVLTDVVGFATSTFRRSIPHVKIPTTLMGYVDASIGIKTGINFSGYKNRIGSFHPPLKVYLDKTFLTSLPQRHIRNGVGEIIKLAIIKDKHLFEQLEIHGATAITSKFQTTNSDPILNQSIEGMIRELEPNLFEDNLSRPMDFGHTFSYMIEMQPNIDTLHGEAVIMDIALSCVIAHKRQLLNSNDISRILTLIEKLNFTLFHPCMTPDNLWQAVIERTQHRDGQQRIPVPTAIGECAFINDLSYTEIQPSIEYLNNWITAREKHVTTI
jgi:2-epi-5-epi-valiolone synthase